MNGFELVSLVFFFYLTHSQIYMYSLLACVIGYNFVIARLFGPYPRVKNEILWIIIWLSVCICAANIMCGEI